LAVARSTDLTTAASRSTAAGGPQQLRDTLIAHQPAAGEPGIAKALGQYLRARNRPLRSSVGKEANRTNDLQLADVVN
jgi:hypothetical protein